MNDPSIAPSIRRSGGQVQTPGEDTPGEDTPGEDTPGEDTPAGDAAAATAGFGRVSQMVVTAKPRRYSAVVENSPRFTATRFLLTAAAIVIVIAGLRAAQRLVIPFLLAMFLAIICSPLVAWLKSKRVPNLLAVVLVVLVLIGVLVGIGALVGGSVNEFIASIPSYERRVNSLVESWSTWLERFDIDLPSVEVMDYINPGAVVGMVGSGLKGLASTFTNAFLITLTMVFILLEAASFPIKARAAFGDAADGDDDPLRISKVTKQVQRYLAAKTAISLATGTLIAVWTAIVGLDFALVWGLLAFLLNYVPNIGSIIAAVPAVLFAVVQLGLWPAVLVAVGFLVVNTVLGNIVEPTLMGRTVGLSTLVVFMSLVFWGWVWGPVGMLLSVPLTMIIKILLESSDELRWVAIMLDSGRAAAARLKEPT
jgi:predicted PurR-regulated permease PerM